MKVWIVFTALKRDDMETDSVWSSEQLADARAKSLYNDEYFDKYGSIMILPVEVDEKLNKA